MTLDELLRVPYERNARGPQALDCWGQVRLARLHLFGRPLLPAFCDVASGDVRAMTKEVVRAASAAGFAPCDPRPGAIATAWQGRTCPHVGIVVDIDGRLRVLDTNVGAGPRLHTLAGFAASFTKVVFYDD